MLVAERLTGAVPTTVIDVVDLGAALLGWVATVASAPRSRRSNVATCSSRGGPTLEATYTRLLKPFFDQIPSDGLAANEAGVDAFVHVAGPQIGQQPRTQW